MSDAEKGGIIAKVTSKVIGDKQRWREYKARVRQLSLLEAAVFASWTGPERL